MQRGGSEVQSFLENSQTLADYRGGQVEGCMKVVTLVQPNSFVETMSKDQQGTEMEENIYANWVMP